MGNFSTSAQLTDPDREFSSQPGRTSRSGLLFTYVLIGWTLFVWVGRVRNVLLDDELAGWSQLWRSLLALSFVGLALVAGGLLLRAVRTKRGPSYETSVRPAKKAAGVLALYGIVIWVIRGTDIFFGSHEVAFIVVHTVLAVVTIVLSAGVIQRFVRAESVATFE